MTRKLKWTLAAVAAAVVVVGAGGGTALATATGDSETPITGEAFTRASEAALAHTGGGKVTETEVGDEDSYYEVEVTLDNGQEVDVQLDENFAVVGSSADKEEAGDAD